MQQFLQRVGAHQNKTMKELLISGFGIDGILNLWYKLTGRQPIQKNLHFLYLLLQSLEEQLIHFRCSYHFRSRNFSISISFADLGGFNLDVKSVDALLYKTGSGGD